MKKLLLAIALIACHTAADARHPAKMNKLADRKTPEAEMLREMLAAQLARDNYAMKGTGALKRLKAHNYVENGTLEDTTYYTYSNDRGSTHPVVNSYYGYYSPSISNSRQYVFCDTMYSRADYSGSGNLYDNYYYYKYDAQNRVVYYVTGYSSFTYGYEITYNSAGQVQTFTTIDLDASPAMPVSNIYFFYNTLGQRTMDSSVDLKTNKPFAKREYLFDVSGNTVAYLFYEYQNNQWVLTSETVHTFDNSNRVVTNTNSYNMGAGLVLNSKDSFGYTGTANQYTHYSTYEWDDVNGEWVPDEMQTYTLNTAGMIDTYYIYTWNGNQWDTTERDIYTYKDGLMVRTNGYLYTGNGNFSSTPYDQMDYYFEEYFPADISSVKTPAAMVLYPNPTTDVLHIKGAPNGSHLSVVNISGQSVYEGIYNDAEAIHTGGYPAGSYIVNIEDAERRIYQGQFTKQ